MAGAARRHNWVLSACLSFWVVSVCLVLGTTSPAGATAPVDLGSLIVVPSVATLTPTAPGPTNGPLSAAAFAAQSSDPHQAAAQFAALAHEPGFASVIRLWTDRTGPGHGANDMAILLFRIPNRTTGAGFAAGLVTPFATSAAARTFNVPSIPGAQAFAVEVSTPVRATEQVVIFRAGQYVVMTQAASLATAANPDPITPSQTIQVAYAQYAAVAHADPVGVSDPPGPTPHRTPAPSGPPLAVIATLLVLAAGVILLLPRVVDLVRRRSMPPGEHWSPHDALALFGAVVPEQPSTDTWPHPIAVPSLPDHNLRKQTTRPSGISVIAGEPH